MKVLDRRPSVDANKSGAEIDALIREARRRQRLRRIGWAAAVTLVLGAVATFVGTSGGGSNGGHQTSLNRPGGRRAPSGPVARVVRSVRPVVAPGCEVSPLSLAISGDVIYVGTVYGCERPGVSRFSVFTSKGTLRAYAEVPDDSLGPVIGDHAIWAITSSGAAGVTEPGSGLLFRFEPSLRNNSGVLKFDDRAVALAAGLGAVWVAIGNEITKIDAASMRVVARRHLPGPIITLAVGSGSLWVLDDAPGQNPKTSVIERLDPHTMRTTARVVLPDPNANFLAADSHRIWTEYGFPRVHFVAVDPMTGKLLFDRASFTVTEGVSAMAADGHDGVWYVTATGQIGHLGATGAPLGTPIRVRVGPQVQPQAMAASPTEIVVAVGERVLLLEPLNPRAK